jgi:hypothetical protein
MVNLQSLKKRLAFVFPASTSDGFVRDESVAEYVEDFDRVLTSMGCDDNDLLSAIDKNWDSWRPSFGTKQGK